MTEKGANNAAIERAASAAPICMPYHMARVPTSPALNAAYRHLSSAPLIGWYVIQQGRLHHADDGLVQMLGYDHAGQLIGRSVPDLIHPDDRSRIGLHNGPTPPLVHLDNQTLHLRKQDGTRLKVMCREDLAIFDGKPAHMGCMIDTTAIALLEGYLEKFQTTLNEVDDVVVELDLKGNITFYTDAACQLWNVSRSEVLGRNYKRFMDADSAGIVRSAYTQIFQTEKPGKNIIYEIHRNDGKRIFVEDSASVLRDRDGAVIGFRTVSRDITERRAVEQQMAAQRAHLHAVFRSVADAIITVAPDMRVIEANGPAQTICGLAAATTAGRKFPPSRRHCTRGCAEWLRQTLEKKTTIRDYHVECGLATDRRQIVSMSSSPLVNERGAFMGAVLVVRDITQLRDLERELGQQHHYGRIIGKSRKMQDIYLLLEDLADVQTTVLITGESGTGKTMIAKTLHQSGRRASKPFVTVNCSALAESLLESELFGHVKGAFTGAVQNKKGRFEAADGGTLLLDEIGDIPLRTQLKLLRVIQEMELERVGESVPRKVDVRVIACTHQDLRQKIGTGAFREDLYYRLKVVEIHVPPLRERMEDVPLLVQRFCSRLNQRFDKAIKGVANDVLSRFMAYHWPGNVRELEHAMESAFVRCDEPLVSLGDLPPEIRDTHIQYRPGRVDGHPDSQDGSRKILAALKKTYWNRSKAAQLLGISRQTLYRKIKEFGIGPDADTQTRNKYP